MRVRGLKLYSDDNAGKLRGSHPVRVRGLKPVLGPNQLNKSPSHPVRVRGLKLASDNDVGVDLVKSHPVRVRGLKHFTGVRIKFIC